METTYNIPRSNLNGLRNAIEKADRKATKLGFAPVTVTVGDEYVVSTKDDSCVGGMRHTAMVNVTISGEVPHFAGWTFAATLQHLPEGNIVRSVPGVSVPAEFRSSAPHCDHCKTARRRIDTYVLASETGDFKQVGSNCLADFIGSTDVNALVAKFDYLKEIADAADESSSFGGGRGSSVTHIETLMTLVCTVVRVDGAFVSNTKARESFDNVQSTISAVHGLMYARGQEKKELEAIYPTTRDDIAQAEAVVAWARENIPSMLSASPDNDYLYNMSLVVNRDYLDDRMHGLAASMISCYNRAMAQKAEAKKSADSKHFGTVGERIKQLGVTLARTTTHEGMYGTTYISSLVTDAGDVAVWFGSNPLRREDDTLVEVGERVVVAATVKKHDTRNGVKQTVLTRCTVWTALGLKLEEEKVAKKAAREAKKAQKAVVA